MGGARNSAPSTAYQRWRPRRTLLAVHGKNTCDLKQQPAILVAIGRQGAVTHHLERIHASRRSRSHSLNPA